MSPAARRAAVVRVVGDRGLEVVLGTGDRPDAAVAARVRALKAAVDARGLPGVAETVGGYQSLLAVFDPVTTPVEPLRRELAGLARAAAASPATAPSSRTVRIPFCVCPACAPDAGFAAERLGLPWDEVVRRFAAAPFTVWLMGFQPGFPFLGPLPDDLALPRLPEPRVRVPAGSVGIGGRQAGIYPRSGPGGWRLLGRTAVPLFDPAATPPARLAVGDRVVFAPDDRHAAHGFAER